MRPRLPPTTLRALLLIILAACAPREGVAPAAEGSARGRTEADRASAGRATFPSGRVFALEVARTPEQQARGYMGRVEIPREEGMIFPSRTPAVRKFWMKNCFVPIDMIWLDRDNRVVAIENSAPPCKADPCPVYGPDVPSWSVLEVRGGEALAEKLAVGDRLEILLDR
jgi:uncharacterized protein